MIFGNKYINKIILPLAIAVILLTACGRKSMEGFIIITEGELNQGKLDYFNGESWRYTSHSRLIAIDPSNTKKSPLNLTSEFFSAHSPEVSYDGTHLLFAGQKKQNDPWQIWEMDLRTNKVKQVTKSSDNSIDPAYLPGDRIVFSRSSINDTLKSGHILFTCNLDGSNLQRITFNPHAYFASSVLKDGRVITISRQLFPLRDRPAIMVLRPDGTKTELFYKGLDGCELCSRPWETDNGKIVFIESGNDQFSGRRVIAINYNRPLHTRADLTSSLPGDCQFVYPRKSGKLLVAYRAEDKKSHSLHEFDPDNKIIVKEIYSSTEGDVLEAVEVNVHERPRKLPSEVDMGVKTGLLLCQNINVTGMTSPESGFATPKADRIELIGVDSALGVVKVQKDGSVYLKVSADMPFRIRTIDSKGATVNGPGGWYWLRPNERRGCIGCHEDNEMVPANRYAIAVSKNPVAVPVHITGIEEKEVELE